MSFFSTDTAPTEIYTLSLHDALPISCAERAHGLTVKLAKSGGIREAIRMAHAGRALGLGLMLDRKSTRLNSSHPSISYAVFCLKKKKSNNIITFIYHSAPCSDYYVRL